MGDLLVTKASHTSIQRVDALLREAFGDGFRFDGEDVWMGQHGSTAVTVKVWAASATGATVHVNADVVHDVMITPLVCYDLLTSTEYRRSRIGRWEIVPDVDGNGKGTICLGVDLIDAEGSLDASELLIAVQLLAVTADGIDDDLAARYGGRTAFADVRHLTRVRPEHASHSAAISGANAGVAVSTPTVPALTMAPDDPEVN